MSDFKIIVFAQLVGYLWDSFWMCREWYVCVAGPSFHSLAQISVLNDIPDHSN